MHDIHPHLRVHLWLETPEGQVLGLGRTQLLEAVHRLGSLNQAAKALGMSYRGAWGRLKQAEEILGESLVERTPGRKGFVLTPLGHEMVATFRRFFRRVEEFAVVAAQEEFPWPVARFQEPPAGPRRPPDATSEP